MESLRTTMSMNNEVYKVNNNVQCNNVPNNRNAKDLIADKLCTELGNTGYRAFYCKVAYTLSEAQILNALEQAKRGRSPAKLFTWLVKQQGV